MGQLPGGWLLLFGNLDEKDRTRLERLVKLEPAFLGEQSAPDVIPKAIVTPTERKFGASTMTLKVMDAAIS